MESGDPAIFCIVMSRLVWVGVLLTALLAQSAPAAACFTGKAASMPCCKPGTDCASQGFNAPSCCRVDAPVDRQLDADRSRTTPPPSPDRAVDPAPNMHIPANHDPLASSHDIAGSPPRDTGTPIYLRLGAFLI